MKKVFIHLFNLVALILVIYLFSLLIVQRIYAITVTNPTPNPFNPGAGQKATISFSVDNSQYVIVKIVNQFTSRNGNCNPYKYYNVWGNKPENLDTVCYYKEVVKAQVARIYAIGGKMYSVSWDGTADKGGIYNLCQKRTYYFVVIPENSPQYTVYKPVQITMWNPSWLAYIRQARTWIGTYPYVASGANTVSRDNGKGTNCTGFVATVFREMGYYLYYGNFPADGIYRLTMSTSWGGGPYMTTAGTEQQSDPRHYTLVKQSNILAWKPVGSKNFTHVTIATYKDGNGWWWIIHSSAKNKRVWEEVIPEWYWDEGTAYFEPPTVFHWIAIGRGGS